MKKNRVSSQRLTRMALLLAAAFILSWIEFMIAIPMIIPGIKIGLANLAILFTIYYCGKKDAFFVLTGRLILNAILFGNLASFLYSAAGGLLSFAAMCFSQKIWKEHIITVSTIGGVFHNLGQLTAAFILLNSFAPVVYTPYLILGGMAAGFFNGWISKRILACRYFYREDTLPEKKQKHFRL